MKPTSHRFALIVLTQTEARVWGDGLSPGSAPVRLRAPDPKREHHHVREGQHHGGHSRDANEEVFFEAVARAVGDVGEVLVLGHGHGQSSAVDNFSSYVERKHERLAPKIAARVKVDLSSMTDADILAYARHWFDTHARP